MATVVSEKRSFGDLLRDLSTDSRTLVRQEVDLAKAELAEKAGRIGADVGKIAVGGAIAFAGALALLAAVVTGVTALLATFLPEGVAVFMGPLLVGGALAFIGYGMLRKGLDAARGETLVPEKTRETLQENTTWLKEKLQ